MIPFRSTCPTAALVLWCRALKHGLGVGLSPVKIFRQQAKSGPAALRDAADRIAARLDTGDSFSEALRPEAGRFPVLFVESVAAGEMAGRLSDVLGELESHYTALQSAKKRLLASLTWPAFSLGGAILVLTILIAVMGAVAPGTDVLGLGLRGTFGALTFLFLSGVLIGGLVGAVMIVSNDESLKAKLLGLALKLPVFAECVRAFALARFSMAWHMMAEAGLKADRVMGVALRCTANLAYRSHEKSASKSLHKGDELTEVLANCGPTLFPEEYVEAARVGEETGRLAEVMQSQAEHYGEESERRLKTLGTLASVTIYGLVSLFIIVMIFRLFSQVMNPYNNVDLRGLDKDSGGALGLD